MMRRIILGNRWIALAICLAVMGIPPVAYAERSPLEIIRAGTDRVLELIRPCKPGESINVQAYRDEIRDIVYDYFDFREMAMRTLGPHWRNQPAEKQNEFVRLFEKLLSDTYLDRVDTYTCSDETVAYDEERIEGKYALVRTRVIGYKNSDVSVDYRMRLGNEGWKVYDVVVEGVSLVNNYRSQFSSILNRQPFDNLLRQIRDKIESW